MRNALETIDIKEIMILSSHDEIMIKGIQHRDYLHFETKLFVNSTQLNKLLNELQKLNEEQEITSMFKSQPGTDGNDVFYFDTTQLSTSTVELYKFEPANHLLQIRA